MARAFFGDRDFTFDLGDKRFVFMDDAGPRWADFVEMDPIAHRLKIKKRN